MKLHKFFDQNSPEYVILHAQRGKRPSGSFNGTHNPLYDSAVAAAVYRHLVS